MFTVEIGKRKIEVRFSYSKPNKIDYEIYSPMEFRALFGTHCFISELILSDDVPWEAGEKDSPENTPVERYREDLADGLADLSIKDQFNRNIGRKKSLARALKNAGFSKADRTLVWKAYNNAVGAKYKWAQS